MIMRTILAVLAIGAATQGAEKKVKFQDLPPAVQQTVKTETAGATLAGLTRESEHGKIQYEAETKIDGRTRDLLIDSAGAVIAIEDEVAIDTLPAPARSAIEKHAAGAKIIRVEKITKGSAITYEAAIKHGLRTREFVVNPEGLPVK
jgi:hypothetical protein